VFSRSRRCVSLMAISAQRLNSFLLGGRRLDLHRTIQELHAERRRVIQLINAVEEIAQCYSLPAGEKDVRRRGRKSMSAAERQQVSDRMRKYWAMRRATQQNESMAAIG
jgi:hypothetical protein